MIKRIVPILVLFVLVSTVSFWFSYRNKSSNTQQSSTANDTLLVGTNAEFPPFSMIENNKIVGLDIDIIKEIAKRLNKKISISNMSFAALVPELQMGTIQVIAAGVSPSEQRAKRAFFTKPHLSDDPLMAIQKAGSEPITEKNQLMDKSIAVNQGYTADNYVSSLGALNVVRLSSPLISIGLLAVSSGQADVYVAAKSSLKPFIQMENNEYSITPIDETGESIALAVSKKYPDLFSSIEKVVAAMMSDGTIEQLKKKWKLND